MHAAVHAAKGKRCLSGGFGRRRWGRGVRPSPAWTGGGGRPGLLSSSLLQNCRLNDDTLLEDVSLARPSQAELPDLRAEEQALVLGVWWVWDQGGAQGSPPRTSLDSRCCLAAPTSRKTTPPTS